MKGRVKDAFGLFDDAVEHYGVEGCVIVVDISPDASPPSENDQIVLVRNRAWAFVSVARDVRKLSPTALGFFVPNLRVEEASLNSVVMWHEPDVAQLVQLVKESA